MRIQRVRTVVVACAILGASIGCEAPGRAGESAEHRVLSDTFLQLLAPTDGDTAARVRGRAEILLAEATSVGIRACMADAGFATFADLPVLQARERNATHSEFASPTKLESRGIVSVADPEFDRVPAEAIHAVGRCTGETTARRSAVPAVDRFLSFRDSRENPFHRWNLVVREEMTNIAASNDASVAQYRECFRQLGMPADVAQSPPSALDWLIVKANEAAPAITPHKVRAWLAGKGIIDGDGGRLARRAATCFRAFEEHLTPRLEARRHAVVERERDRLLDGQERFFEAIGSRSFEPPAAR
jgi:hypothetical protein